MKIVSSKIPGVIAVMSFFLLLTVMSVAVANTVDESILHPPIPLLDEAGNHVRDSGKPYSPKISCGSSGCHDYDAITHAYHFEAGRDEARDDFGAKRGLPHLVSPGYFGGYTCMGGSNPEVLAKKNNASEDDFADRGSAGLIKRCIGCHTGGGWMEKDRNGKKYSDTDPTTITRLDGDYFNRGTDENNQDTDVNVVARWDWNKSGVVEADCMLCHTDFSALKKFDAKLGADDGSDGTDSAYDQFRNLRGDMLVKEGGYFRFAASAILEFLNLKHPDGSVDEMSLLTFEREIEPSAGGHGDSGGPDYTLTLGEDELPVINWNSAAFDSNGKALIPMLRFPGNDNCMLCHRTSNSRRGFYGFGEVASATYEDSDDGPIVEDYKDDVHKGKTWTEPNGETRSIENCNVCHSRNYFKEPFENVDLNADHNFLKGNSDMDVRNDLDYNANAKTCEYCHNDAPAPAELAIPSGHEDMLSAHREIWKANGDMSGYPVATLTKITQTHLDVISCQACHITGKKSRGRTIQILYRYRAEANGVLKIVPYNPRLRYYWKDRNSGRVLNKTERNSVFELREENGEQYGAIVDASGKELSRVSTRISHGSLRFGDPDDYDGFIALKNAYDSLLLKKGVSNPDAVMVRTESNQYIISHNARPSPASVQCEECHNRKQNGAFSALVSTDGLFGEGNVKTVTQLPDRRLVDEGIVQFDFPYMKVDESGKVTETVADILFATKVDPSMTVLRSATAAVAAGVMKQMSISNGMNVAGIDSVDDAATLEQLFNSDEIYLYQPNYGNHAVRAVSLMTAVNGQSELVFPTYRMQVALADSGVVSTATNTGLGELSSQVFSLEAVDKNSNEVVRFSGSRVLVKLPYEGTNTSVDAIKVVFSTDSNNWSAINQEDIVIIEPHSDEVGAESEGYVAFMTDHFSDYAIVNSDASVTPPQQSGDVVVDDTPGSGGGSAGYILLLLGLIGGCHLMFRRRQKFRG
ncbi:MAG: cytochrome C [Gammaproteobacteria bacterium]|nr:cytochrome C [Gammaproteobacteria bacterium]